MRKYLGKIFLKDYEEAAVALKKMNEERNIQKKYIEYSSNSSDFSE